MGIKMPEQKKPAQQKQPQKQTDKNIQNKGSNLPQENQPFKKKLEEIYERHQKDIEERKRAAAVDLSGGKAKRTEEHPREGFAKTDSNQNKKKNRDIKQIRKDSSPKITQNFTKQNEPPKIQLEYKQGIENQKQKEQTKNSIPKAQTEPKNYSPKKESIDPNKKQDFRNSFQVPPQKTVIKNNPQPPKVEKGFDINKKEAFPPKEKHFQQKREGSEAVPIPPKPSLRNEWGLEGGDKISPIRTYQNDIASTVKEKKESLTSVREKETKRARARGDKPRYEEKRETQKKTLKREKLVRILSTVFVVLIAGAGLYAGYSFYLSRTDSGSVNSNPSNGSGLISFNTQKTISLSESQEMTEAIRKIIGDTQNSAGIVKIEVLNNEGDPATAQEFINALGKNAPSYLTRNIGTYIFGVHSSQSQKNPFLVLQATNFSYGLAGMLDWERTLSQDLKVLFPSFPNQQSDGVWKDLFTGEINTRTQDTENGFIYTINNQGKIMISTNPETLTTIEQMTEK